MVLITKYKWILTRCFAITIIRKTIFQKLFQTKKYVKKQVTVLAIFLLKIIANNKALK